MPPELAPHPPVRDASSGSEPSGPFGTDSIAHPKSAPHSDSAMCLRHKNATAAESISGDQRSSSARTLNYCIIPLESLGTSMAAARIKAGPLHNGQSVRVERRALVLPLPTLTFSDLTWQAATACRGRLRRLDGHAFRARHASVLFCVELNRGKYQRFLRHVTTHRSC
jgi:hypothetical protein